MNTALTEHSEVSRLRFARYYRTELRNDVGYLARIIPHMNVSFCCLVRWKRKIAESGVPNAQIKYTRRSMTLHRLWVRYFIGTWSNRPLFPRKWERYGLPTKRCSVISCFPSSKSYPENMVLQQDGAPPHYSLDVREYLHQNLPNRSMARGAPISWPSRPTDLTPRDFFL